MSLIQVWLNKVSSETTNKVFTGETSALSLVEDNRWKVGYVLVFFSILFDVANLLSQLLKIVLVIGILLLKL